MIYDSRRASAALSTEERGLTISLRSLTKSYGGDKPAVSDVDLDVAAGEFVAFLGPSGSGKTTTLNMIAGLESPTSGELLFDGSDVNGVPAHRRNLGMLFQNYALFPHMSVAQNVAYPLKERRMGKQEIADKVAAALELVEMSGRAAANPAQLSGGQQQRVALARAIVFEPKALLLDEPLGALDKNLRATLQRELKRIHRDVQSTFLFVTHDQEEAMTLADRIALFRNGELEQVGTPWELYNEPKSLFAAQFLGESNVFSVDTTDRGYLHGSDLWQIAGGGVAASEDDGDGRGHLIVRPEKMRLVGPGDETQTPSAAGVVEQVEYLGVDSKIVIARQDDTPITVRVPSGDYVPEMGSPATAAWDGADQWLVRR